MIILSNEISSLTDLFILPRKSLYTNTHTHAKSRKEAAIALSTEREREKKSISFCNRVEILTRFFSSSSSLDFKLRVHLNRREGKKENKVKSESATLNWPSKLCNEGVRKGETRREKEKFSSSSSSSFFDRCYVMRKKKSRHLQVEKNQYEQLTPSRKKFSSSCYISIVMTNKISDDIAANMYRKQFSTSISMNVL